jgi:hypothetical protein
MRKIIFILFCTLGFYSCTKPVPVMKTPEQLRVDSIAKADSVRKDSVIRAQVMLGRKYNFITYTNNFLSENPNWLNNGFTKKEGDKEFKKLLAKDFSKIGYYNKFELRNVLVNGNKIHIHLIATSASVWLSIVGTLDKSVDTNSLKEGDVYRISGGKFIKFIGSEDASNLTGWNITLMTDEVGIDNNVGKSYSFGSSYWKNIKLKRAN